MTSYDDFNEKARWKVSSRACGPEDWPIDEGPKSIDATDVWDTEVSFLGLDFGKTPEHGFVYGVELGMIMQRMLSGLEENFNSVIHEINRVAIERACLARRWSAEFRDTEIDGWLTVHLRKLDPNG